MANAKHCPKCGKKMLDSAPTWTESFEKAQTTTALHTAQHLRHAMPVVSLLIAAGTGGLALFTKFARTILRCPGCGTTKHS